MPQVPEYQRMRVQPSSKRAGNAVDAAIAASLVAVTTEPGICSLGGGGYITIWPTHGNPVTFDGNIEMPGRNVAPERLGKGAWEVSMDYGGGVSTLIGHGSVGTPGCLAAYDSAWQEFGKAKWPQLLAPAIEHANNGFPLSTASYSYLKHSHDCVYGWLPESHSALHHRDGGLKQVGELISVPHLAKSLTTIAEQGAQSFYHGDLAKLIAEDSDANGGVLTGDDLAGYQIYRREPLMFDINDWQLATNPAPAVGGASLVAMLELLKDRRLREWNAESAAAIADIQHRVLMYRFKHLDYSNTLNEDIRELLDLARQGNVPVHQSAPSTVHTSAVDCDGLACSITMSSGYGAGVMPPGTGIWMNNCLGEVELNRKGLNAGPPGMRLASNMAPTVGRHSNGHTLAIGSPGADRITSALLCTLNNFLNIGMSLEQAIAHPRLHLEINNGVPRVAYEEGIDASLFELPCRHFPEPSMFFGGVGATLLNASGELTSAADPRRAGGFITL